MDKQTLTSDQAISVLRNLAAHPELRFLNLSEHDTVQRALAVLETAVRGPTIVADE